MLLLEVSNFANRGFQKAARREPPLATNLPGPIAYEFKVDDL